MENYGILLIDDEAAYHAIVAALLAPHAIKVETAVDADAALAAISRGWPALILLDVQLGADDGRDLVASLRRMRGDRVNCPIIAFTTMRPTAGERYFLDRGFDGWFPKPFRATELLAVVGSRLGVDLFCRTDEPDQNPLVALLGDEAAAAMTERLHNHLRDAVTAIENGADPRPIGHRIGGLAGTMGYPALGAAWLSLQENSAAWPTVRALTIETLARD